MGELYIILAAVGGAILAIAGAFFKGKQAGRDSVAAAGAKKDAQLQMEFDKIDSERPDYDAAVNSLRKRASDKR